MTFAAKPLTPEQLARFHEDGFLVVERLIEPEDAARAAARFELLFEGKFETGLIPDDWNWGEGVNTSRLNRQISNAWKSDYTIASIALRPGIGLWCAQLGGWPGARVNQHDLVWKLPGSLAVKMHQDILYDLWVTPSELISCWIALTDTSREAGTIEYARGSHKWGLFQPKSTTKFYGVEDYTEELRAAAAQAGGEVEIVPVEVPAGGGVFHSGRTWHGSGPCRDPVRDRRALATHCCSSESRFSSENLTVGMGAVFTRYKRFNDDTMDESFFPILWTEDGRRSAFLDEYMTRGSARRAA